MSRLMVPISSPTSTSTRESAARAERARPLTPAARAAPVAAAPPMNLRLPIFAMFFRVPLGESSPSLLRRLHGDRVQVVLRGAEPVEHHLEGRRQAPLRVFERDL